MSPVKTYHCLCTSLLLATTHTLSALPRRSKASLDNALILPIVPFPAPHESDHETLPDADAGADASATTNTSQPTRAKSSQWGHTVLLDVIKDRKATIVRREDGFEKRFLWRCGRCRVAVGYELDAAHWEAHEQEHEHAQAGDEQISRPKVLYVLPGGVQDTATMAAGKTIEDDAVAFGAGPSGKPAVAVWE